MKESAWEAAGKLIEKETGRVIHHGETDFDATKAFATLRKDINASHDFLSLVFEDVDAELMNYAGSISEETILDFAELTLESLLLMMTY